MACRELTMENVFPYKIKSFQYFHIHLEPAVDTYTFSESLCFCCFLNSIESRYLKGPFIICKCPLLNESYFTKLLTKMPLFCDRPLLFCPVGLELGAPPVLSSLECWEDCAGSYSSWQVVLGFYPYIPLTFLWGNVCNDKMFRMRNKAIHIAHLTLVLSWCSSFRETFLLHDYFLRWLVQEKHPAAFAVWSWVLGSLKTLA